MDAAGVWLIIKVNNNGYNEGPPIADLVYNFHN